MIRLRMPLRHPLAREIAVVLAIKVLALTALYVAFFGPDHRPHLTPESMERAILGAVSVPADPAPASVPRPADHRRNAHHV